MLYPLRCDGGERCHRKSGGSAHVRRFETHANPSYRLSTSIRLQIHEVHPKTYALTVHALSGSVKDLPAHLLSEHPTVDGPQPIQSMTITSPTMLETALLELDGRIDRSRRPNGNAWKSFTIWRWRGGGFNPVDSRGGRENRGTLFYLRACYSQER